MQRRNKKKVYMDKMSKQCVIFCSYLIFLALFCMTGFTTALPAIAYDFNTSPTHVKLLLTFFLIPYGIIQIVYGPLSDRIGRKPVIIIALVTLLIGNLSSFFALSINVLQSAAAISGLGAGVASVIGRALIQDVTIKSNFAVAISIVSAWGILGANMGPLIGGILQHHFGWRTIFLLYLILTSILLLHAIFKLPETLKKTTRVPISMVCQLYFRILKEPSFTTHTLICALLFGITVSYFSMSPFIYQKILQLTPQHNGLITCFLIIAVILGNILFRKSSGFFSDRINIIAGMILILFSSLLMLFSNIYQSTTLFWIIGPMAVIYFAYGNILPLIISRGLLKHAHHAGTAGALQGAIKFFVGSIIGLFSAHIHESSGVPLAALLCIDGGIVIGLYLFFSGKV